MNIDNPAELIAYLRDTGRIAAQEAVHVLPLAGGVSNRTVLIERATGAHWVCKQALSKLRVAEDWFCDPARIGREALGLEWFARLAAPGSVPALVFFDPAEHLLIMEAVPQPHENWKSLLIRGVIDFDLVRQFGSLLGRLHRDSAGRTHLAEIFADRSYFEALRLEAYYITAARRNADAAPFCDDLIAETRATRAALVHGDFSPKNTLVAHRGHLVLLDFEVVHFGDPAFDIGFSMTHFLSKALHLPAHRAAFLAAARLHWTAYCAATTEQGTPVDPGLESRAVRHTLACLLARVDGRSPLEYLSADERCGQRRAVLAILRHVPARLPELIQAFAAGISR